MDKKKNNSLCALRRRIELFRFALTSRIFLLLFFFFFFYVSSTPLNLSLYDKHRRSFQTEIIIISAKRKGKEKNVSGNAWTHEVSQTGEFLTRVLGGARRGAIDFFPFRHDCLRSTAKTSPPPRLFGLFGLVLLALTRYGLN